MKKIFTLSFLSIALIINAQDVRKWQGSASDEWDYATSNWVPVGGLPLPTSFIEGNKALFDDTRAEKDGENKISVTIPITASEIEVNNTEAKPYFFSVGGDIAGFIGDGVLIKKGDGELKSNVTNNMTGGTVAEGGVIITEKNDSPNIFGDKVVFKGGAIMSGTGATGYSNIVADFEIPEGQVGEVITTRYTDIKNKLTGAGTLNFISKGERVFLKMDLGADWSEFSGDVNIIGDPSHNGGYLGLGFKTTLEYDATEETGIDQTFANNVVDLQNGSLYSESGVRCFEIGNLSGDATSTIYGYMKSSTTPRIYYKVGGLNKNSTYAGQIRPVGDGDVVVNGQTIKLPRRDNTVGIIKVGTGTMKFTNGENFITGGIDVREGTVLISNPENTRSGTGYSSTYGTVIWVGENATVGGTGRISGHVEVKGTFAPGDKGVGTITIKDFEDDFREDGKNPRVFQLFMNSNSTLEMQLGTAEASDKIVSDSIRIDDNVTLDIKLANSYNLKAGDVIQLWESSKSYFSQEFATINLPKLDENWEWDVSDLYETGTIKLVAGGGEFVDVGFDNIQKQELTIYPNPNNGSFKVSVDATFNKLEVYNIGGQIVYKEDALTQNKSVSLNVKPGVYFVKVYTNNGTIVEKIVVK